MTPKTLDALTSGVVDVIRKTIAPRDAHLRSLEQRLTELGERNKSLEQKLSDLVVLVHLMHDVAKGDSSTTAAGRDVH